MKIDFYGSVNIHSILKGLSSLLIHMMLTNEPATISKH